MTSLAGQLVLGAARIRAEAEAWNQHRATAAERRNADATEARARQQLPEPLKQIGAGHELVPAGDGNVAPAEYRSTVRNPDYVTAAASRDRLDLLNDASALELGLYVADTIDARDSIETMLAHQLAVSHKSIMKLATQLNRQIERMNVLRDDVRQSANVEATRVVNAVSRLMAAYQQGAQTLQRLRSGGRQVVTVQYVNIANGGQAIVTGELAKSAGVGLEVPDGGEGEK